VQRGLQQPSLRPWKTTPFDKHKPPFFGLLAALYFVKMSGGGMDAVLQASKNGNEDDVLALFAKAAENGHARAVQTLLEWRGSGGEWCDPRSYDNYALRRASEYGHAEVVRTLLAWRGSGGEWCDPRACNTYAVRSASYYGHEDVARTLLAWRGLYGEWCDPRAKDNFAVQWASISGHVNIVRALLAWRGPRGEWCDPRMSDNIAIHWASVYGHINIVRALLAWRGPSGEWCDVGSARSACLAGMSSHQALLLDACDLEDTARREWTRVRAAWIAVVVGRNR